MRELALLLGIGVPIIAGIMSVKSSRKKERQKEAERLAEEQRKSEEEAARSQEEKMAEREQDAIQSYSDAIFQKLESYKFYPKAAEQSGLSGRVVLRFTVRPDGEVIDPLITKVTGHSSFGDAALQALRQVAQLPSFPAEIRRCELSSTLYNFGQVSACNKPIASSAADRPEGFLPTRCRALMLKNTRPPTDVVGPLPKHH